MAVDLADLIEPLRREVNTPGSDSFPTAFEDTYLGYLQDSFWQIKLDGITSFVGYTEDGAGVVTPIDPSDEDLSRTLQQLIVLYAGIRMVRNQLLNLQTLFRSKAGPVEYETQQSAQLLKAVLDELKFQRNLVLENLSAFGGSTTYYIDSLAARESSIDSGFTYWPSS